MGGKMRHGTHNMSFCASVLEHWIAVVFLILERLSLWVGPQIPPGGVASLDRGTPRSATRALPDMLRPFDEKALERSINRPWERSHTGASYPGHVGIADTCHHQPSMEAGPSPDNEFALCNQAWRGM
ncbi:hypothetical protein [Salinisphaera sp. Q1T1-3]|uniref:hypothetical protein n=1 Tax=Salinisphaera sp. Q1T1-3 TaxID=2321229 RepID=UPI000E73D4C2|nr:hypothetical protein [Salinisphaera sp. Q1T1-3]RJS92831.1 hypothetical protein D3260_09735 [Salinisphaera sp. Q1T1-3]